MPFGRAVAIDGDIYAIAARGRSGGSESSAPLRLISTARGLIAGLRNPAAVGTVQLIDHLDGRWVPGTTITGPVGPIGSRFGSPVALSDAGVVAGIYGISARFYGGRS